MRAELFSTDQMEQHGKALARIHTLSHTAPSNRLLQQLDENEQLLMVSYDLLTAAVTARSRIAPAGEWLLDNFYLIEEQIRAARLHLPKGYSRELPRLARGPSSGLPRVYDLALEAISHGDGRVDAEALLKFVAAYQSVSPLTLGELWAIPIMLRLALIENLCRVGARISADRRHVNQAQNWADQMIEMAANDPKNLILVIADMARSAPPMVGPFIAELARRLQGHGPALALPLTWIEQHLAESSLTIERVVLLENQQQAADQVSISNSIGSLRFLGAMDWRIFVETMSVVEAILGEDAAKSYRAMDFASRDRYRHVVDRIAKQSRRSEAEVARLAIDLAQHSADRVGSNAHTAHVGYYLIDQGLPQLERAAEARLPPLTRIRRWLGQTPLALYLGALALITTLSTWAVLTLASGPHFAGWRLLLPAMLVALAASKLAAALVNWVATQLLVPQRLPRMDFSQGIPTTMSTLVVVPCLLLSAENIDELLQSLEVRFLGNQDEHLYFCLLSDFGDAAEATLASDQPLLQQTQLGI
ncbi:MAG: cyclic beta 1-2 glucan synthetase, partial [Lysobacterales bacterium CG02_land_8_20_14_3_00_62_12]